MVPFVYLVNEAGAPMAPRLTLGFETRIAPYDGGKSIEVVFVQKTTDVSVPDSIVYGR